MSVRLELAQVLHLNWDKGLHLDLVAIKPCEVSHACGTLQTGKCSELAQDLSWAQIFQTKSAIKAELGPWTSLNVTQETPLSPCEDIGLLSLDLLGDKSALLGAAFCHVFGLTQPAQPEAMQAAVVMCWSYVLLSLDFPIYLCPGQALLLVETSDLGGD